MIKLNDLPTEDHDTPDGWEKHRRLAGILLGVTTVQISREHYPTQEGSQLVIDVTGIGHVEITVLHKFTEEEIPKIPCNVRFYDKYVCESEPYKPSYHRQFYTLEIVDGPNAGQRFDCNY